jgi:hypothetical protein
MEAMMNLKTAHLLVLHPAIARIINLSLRFLKRQLRVPRQN